MHLSYSTVSLAPFGLESELERELSYKKIQFHKRDRLYFFNANYTPLFAQVTWFDCQTITIASINDGIKQLRARTKNWSLFTIGHHRRAQLIQDGLSSYKTDPVSFLAPEPKHIMGGWTLLDANTLLCSTRTTSRYPLGKIEFIENKTVPPSRAYLKLWELFTIHCQPPQAGSHVLDLGSAPGGWSWVLAQLNTNVTSVDKAPLDPTIARDPHITHLQESAFGLDPHSVPDATWLFSDIICYPERLLTLVTKWMNESAVRNFVCTLKFQGEADFAIIDQFLQIPNSLMVHLYHNKHELMWWKID